MNPTHSADAIFFLKVSVEGSELLLGGSGGFCNRFIIAIFRVTIWVIGVSTYLPSPPDPPSVEGLKAFAASRLPGPTLGSAVSKRTVSKGSSTQVIGF